MKTEKITPKVIIGDRVFITEGKLNFSRFTWTRKDTIFVGDIKIGYFYTSREDRAGSTVSLHKGLSIKGRNIKWCVEMAGPLLANQNINAMGS